MIVSTFEVLLQPTGPSKPPGPGPLAKDTPIVGEVLSKHFVPPEFAASGLPFTVPTALQGYFLYLSNASGSAASNIRVSFISEDSKILATTLSGGLPAFLSIVNTQPPLLDGNTTASGISFGGLTSSGAIAYTDLPSIPASGTILLGLIPNYLDPALVKSGPVGRGYVRIQSTDGLKRTLYISAQTRVVFFEPGNATAGMDTSEAAYSMPSPNGGIQITFSG